MSSSAKDAIARKNEQILGELVKQETNKHCADCGQKGTRWASWNLGVFLCIRCGGLHRRLGTHISRVKSINLDKWTDEQVENMVNNGNAKVNAIYNPNPDRFPFPSYSGDMEQYIRDKYERKLFMSADNAASFSRGAAAGGPAAGSTSRTAVARSGSIGQGATGAERYPLQMGSLQEMGFTDAAANQAALLSTSGNLQQAIEALLSGKAGKPKSREQEYAPSSSSQRKTNAADDLADVFGIAAHPPLISTAAKTSSASLRSADQSVNNRSNSILDMDFPPPPTKEYQQPANDVSDEFEEFESATDFKSSMNQLPSRTESLEPRRSSVTDHHDGFGEIKPSSQVKPVSSADTTLGGNPWASFTDGSGAANGTGDAFDDIDPFRGYNPTTSSTPRDQNHNN